MAERPPLLRELEALLGASRCLSDPAARAVYARDASHMTLGRPLCVCLPAASDEVAGVVSLCLRHGVPYVARGAGTGLSGGALPGAGAVVISLARMEEVGEVDPVSRTVRVGPGAVNERIDAHAAAAGLEFAPDPSSQSAATIGGNIAENAGGPHCLRVGVTARHVRALEWVDPDGNVHGAAAGDDRSVPVVRGVDPETLLIGGEGTLGIVTAAELELVPLPAAAATLLALFPKLDAATDAVVGLLRAGMLPAALELVDRAMLEVVDEAFAFGFPAETDAAMIVEFTGAAAEVAEDAERAAGLLVAAGAAEARLARSDREREDLWRCRKKAFGAVGRLSPAYVTMDVAVPVGRLPDIVRVTAEQSRLHRVRIATALHAGDGNLHPGVMYDDRDEDSMARAHAAADAIILAALEMGGTVTGEHGVGVEKLHLLDRQLDPEAARLMAGIKELYDPRGLCNPGKAVLPFGAPISPRPRPAPADARFDWESLIVSAPADARLADLQREALARGFRIPAGAARADLTVGELVDHGAAGPGPLASGPDQDAVLEIWAETGDGRAFHAGAPTPKNVAGYDLVRLLCGAAGELATPRAATLSLRPAPESIGIRSWSGAGKLDPAALAYLRGILAGRDSALAGPAVRLSEGDLTVLAPGRDRDWDLVRLDADLARWGRDAGLGENGSGILPFAKGWELACGWVARPGPWCVLQRRIGGGAWPLSPLPAGATWIWRSVPEAIWLDRADAESPFGWRSEPVAAADGSSPPPRSSDSDRAEELRRGLKDLFDPGGRLPGPSRSTEAT